MGPSSPDAGLAISEGKDATARPLPNIKTNIFHGAATSHRRIPSSSSSAITPSAEMPSSPTTSTSSKTAAFFGSSGGVLRPASMSVSSSSSSYTSPIKEMMAREDREGGAGSSSTNLNRDGSWRGSQRSNRMWDGFEGKPVTPLPSPSIFEDEGRSRKSNSIFDIDFSQKGSSSSNHHQSGKGTSRDSSRDRQLATFDISISDSFSSLPSLPSLGAIQNGTSSEGQPSSSTSSKTSSFFGASRPPMPAPRISNGGQSKWEEPAFGSNSSSPSSARRFPSINPKLYEPSRLPSMPLEMGVVDGTSASSSSEASTPTLGTPKPIGTLSSAMVQESGRQQRATAAIVPTATISPPSPHPEDPSSDQIPAATSSSSFILSALPSSPSSNKNQSRHAHGPSENATGSSFLPSAEAMHQAQNGQSREKSSVEQKPKANDSSNAPTANVEESEDESESRIGKFHIERILGVGAFSTVALARSTRESAGTGQLVALKMLEREPCMQNERMRVSWVREVEVLKVAGGELFDLLSNHHEDLAQREWLVRLLFGELANAVGWMHSINLVHRDIKLENIILTHPLFIIDNLQPSTLPTSPLLKISDFGLSRFVDPSSPLLETRCGSEEYAAPELIIGKRYDGRKTDVWAMGVVLYALLSGSLPFLSNNSQEDQVEGYQQSFKGRYSREKGVAEESAMARKAHLLRIAKGDLRWPTKTNEDSLDQVEPPCPATHRLVTPLARRLVARLLRRDAVKRATAWEVWDEAWLTSGSIPDESSVGTCVFNAPLDPRSEEGQAWLDTHARVQSGASPLTHDD